MKPPVKDPWRTGQVTPETERPKAARKAPADDGEEHVIGTASSLHPLDEDLHPVRQHLLRAPGQSYALLVDNAHTPLEAVHVLLRAAYNPALTTLLQDAGFQLGSKKDSKPTGFTLYDDERVLWDPQAQNVANGFQRLVQTLLRACREERGFRDRLTQLGLTPIMP